MNIGTKPSSYSELRPCKHSLDMSITSFSDSEEEYSNTAFRSKRLKTAFNILNNYFDIMSELIVCLNDKVAEGVMKHRDNEKKHIVEFILKSIGSGLNAVETAPCLIIFGQPGMGKTKLLNEVANSLTNRNAAECFSSYAIKTTDESHKLISSFKNKPFTSYFFNCMNHNSAIEMLMVIYEKIIGRSYPPQHKNLDYFDKGFFSALDDVLASRYVILMIDELEYFMQKDKRGFKSLIDLLQTDKSGFIRFGISNNLNIISSSSKKKFLNFEFLIFKTYSKEVLKDILTAKVQKILDKHNVNLSTVVNDVSLDFLVKSIVNNRTSDVRALFALTSGVIETKINLMKAAGTDPSTKPNITVKEVIDFFIKNSVKQEYDIIKRLSLYAQVMLLAIYACIQETTPSASTTDIMKAFEKLCGEFCGNEAIEHKSLLELLRDYKIVKFDSNRRGVVQSLISKQELARILSEVETFKSYFEDD